MTAIAATPQIPFNFIPTEPTLTDALDLHKKDIFLELVAHHVGVIQSFNFINQTATATIAYPKTYFQLNSITGVYQPYQVSYPTMLDCPVIFLGGGTNTSLTFPVAKNQECLVLFNDRDFSNWFAGGAGAPVATPRSHSYSDGIILAGLRSSGNVLSNFDLVRALLKGGSAVMGVNPATGKVLISNTTPTGSAGVYTYPSTLNTLIGTLITAIKGLSIDINGFGPGQGVVDATSIAALTVVATQIGLLLE